MQGSIPHGTRWAHRYAGYQVYCAWAGARVAGHARAGELRDEGPELVGGEQPHLFREAREEGQDEVARAPGFVADELVDVFGQHRRSGFAERQERAPGGPLERVGRVLLGPAGRAPG